jgi:hypothetical protein
MLASALEEAKPGDKLEEANFLRGRKLEKGSFRKY